MCTRNSCIPNNSFVTILRRRNKRRTPNVVELELRTIIEMADNRTMEELLQAPTEGYGEAIVILEINADHFEIKTNLLQLDQANPHHGFERENPHTHINNFKRITLTLKFKDVLNDVIKLMMFLYSLKGNARVWENANKSDDRIDKLADRISTLVDIFPKKGVTPAPVKEVEEYCVTCGGAHAYYNCPNTDNNQPSVCVATGTYNQVAPQNRASNYMAPPGFAPNQASTSGTLPSNTIPISKGEMKAITTCSGVAYEGPSISTPKKVVKRETEETTDKEQTNFQGSTAHIQPPVIPILEPDVPKTLPKPNIPYPLRLNDQKLREKATNQWRSFSKSFKIYTSTLDKLFELAKIRLNENYSAMLLKKLPKKLGDPRKFLIPCDFPRMDTTRYFSTYDDLSVNRIDIIDVAREEYAQEILGFYNNSSGGNPTSTSEPILLDSSPSLTSFKGSDFILEEVDTYLKDESISPEIDHADCNLEGDICLIEKFRLVSPIHCVPKKGEITVVENENNELIPTRENASKLNDRIDKLADQISTLVDIFAKKVVTPAPVKAVKESCVTCGGSYAYYNCPNTDSNQLSVCVAMGTYNQVAPQNHTSNFMAPPGFAPVQNVQNRFNQNQGQRNNFNRGNNFQPFQVPNQGFQNQPFQVPNNPVQHGFSNEFLSYKKFNDQMMRNMQNQINSLKGEFKNEIQNTMKTQQIVLMKQQNAFQNNLQNMLSGFFRINPQLRLLKKLGDPGKFLLCDFLGIDVCHALADLDANINLMPLSIWKKLSLPKLTPTRMTLELADRSITHPKGVAEDVFVKVGKFHFPTDFVVVDFEADPRVPLILGRSFLRTGRALIDVYGEEITLRVNDEAATFNLNQTTRYSSTYDDLSVNRIDIIDVAREEYAQEILGFSNNSSGGNPTSTSEPILSNSSPSLTPFVGKGDIFLIEKLLNDDPFQLLLMDLKQGSVDKLPVIIANDLKVDEKEALLKVLKFHKRAIAWKITDIKVKGVRSFLGHASFYRRFVQDFSKIARPMTHLLEKDTPFVFSKDCIDAFETHKKKLIEAPIFVVPDWNLPFKLMCDASDFAIGAVLGQRKTKHFQPIHYASKAMTEAQIHYTTTEKEMLAIVYAFEKFRLYLVLSKSIVYTDHSALKYLLSKQDAKPRLIRWVFLLQEFDIIIRDKKGTKNLAADHLFRLENPHKDVFENKDINENFPLETLGKSSSRSTPWFVLNIKES
nr:reverse transcriptase domain-containing protein [Tanacetum cinerariifolium]